MGIVQSLNMSDPESSLEPYYKAFPCVNHFPYINSTWISTDHILQTLQHSHMFTLPCVVSSLNTALLAFHPSVS
jgi:hypothetical protein